MASATPTFDSIYEVKAQNQHIDAICGLPKVASDVTSGRNVEAIRGKTVVNFELASSSSLG